MVRLTCGMHLIGKLQELEQGGAIISACYEDYDTDYGSDMTVGLHLIAQGY